MMFELLVPHAVKSQQTRGREANTSQGNRVFILAKSILLVIAVVFLKELVSVKPVLVGN